MYEPHEAENGLISRLYEQLRELAHNYLKRERAGHTLSTTALIHEAYVRLAQGDHLAGVAHTHFLCLAARAMRETLVDYARQRNRLKRGGGVERIPINEALAVFEGPGVDLVALDEAMDRLHDVDPQLTQITEMRFFGGMTEAQTAEALGLSAITIRRRWRLARMWLYDQLKSRSDDES